MGIGSLSPEVRRSSSESKFMSPNGRWIKILDDNHESHAFPLGVRHCFDSHNISKKPTEIRPTTEVQRSGGQVP
ncbi:hypothetical protein Q1695_003450 [Nippostrongylus brasiliensis]|nr:hypothetical protein Q1695_003450 [Nippostrongylus brasiliensis]